MKIKMGNYIQLMRMLEKIEKYFLEETKNQQLKIMKLLIRKEKKE